MILLLAAVALAAIPTGLSGWEVLRDDDVWVGCVQRDGYPWCRSRAEVSGDLTKVERVLLDVANYPNVFHRVTQVQELAPFLLHVVLDMPFPLSDRDYVAQYVRHQDGHDVVFSWQSVQDAAAQPTDAVRLAHSEGEWRLTPKGSRTAVTYTWNAELGGDVPEFALPRARRQWGEEVLVWLDDAVRR